MNLAHEIKKVHKALRRATGNGIIVEPLSDKAKEWLKDEGYKVGEVETPCGCTGHNSVER